MTPWWCAVMAAVVVALAWVCALFPSRDADGSSSPVWLLGGLSLVATVLALTTLVWLKLQTSG